MVNIKKDERKIEIKGNNVVEFKHENIQHYTEEQARNVYVNFLNDLETKEKYLVKFGDIEKQTAIEFEKQLDNLIPNIKRLNPKLKEVEIRNWKQIQMILNSQEIKSKLGQLEQDIKFIKQGIEIWKECEKLPETEYERKLKKAKKGELS